MDNILISTQYISFKAYKKIYTYNNMDAPEKSVYPKTFVTT